MDFDFSSIYSMVGSSKAIFSVIAVLIVWLLRSVVLRSIVKGRLDIDVKKSWVTQIKNLSFILIFFILILIWSAEIQSVALSLAAFAAAIAIAGKEMILCFLGGLYKAMAHPYRIGDRVQLDGHRGTVSENSLISTIILEIGPGNGNYHYTGKVISIPNSVLLLGSVVNETNFKKVVPHVFSVEVKRDDNWQQSEQRILDIATDKTRDYIKLAQREQVAKEFYNIGLQPKSKIQIKDFQTIILHLRIVAPADQKGAVVQEIIREYLS